MQWAYIARPDGGASDTPVVVVAHGQGLGHLVNCEPADVPSDFTVRDAALLANALAGEGYTAVAIAYRNAGRGSPSGTSAKLRDLDELDARAVLAAAHAAGPTRASGVAFVGASNGTFAALWAASTRPELAELQRGLDIRSVVIVGHTTNAVANAAQVAPLVAASDKRSRQQAIAGGLILALNSAVATELSDTVSVADLRGSGALASTLDQLVTPQGLSGLEALLFRPADLSIEGCGSLAGRPVVCDDACVAGTFSAAADPGAVSDFVRQPVLDAVAFWGDGTAAKDPGPSSTNVVLAATRRVSPVYTATGFATTRALVLISDNDHVTNGHGPAARSGLLELLQRFGVQATVPVVRSDAAGLCEHGDYFKPARACGYGETVAELRTAFGR